MAQESPSTSIMANIAIPFHETCILCPRRASKRCPTCKSACYCSKGKRLHLNKTTLSRKACRTPETFTLTCCTDCQALDWKNHKILCATFKDPEPEPHNSEPGVSYRRGLYFPGGKEAPRFVWVETYRDEESGLTFEKFDHNVWLGQTEVEQFFPDHNNLQARDVVGETNEALVCLCKQDIWGAAPNLAIKKFARGGSCAKDFRGPWLVMRQWRCPNPAVKSDADQQGQGRASGTGDEIKRTLEEYRDVNMRDVRNAADFFTTAFRHGSSMDNRIVMGVVVSVQGDHAALGHGNKFTWRALHSGDEVFWDEGSGIANLLGIPIFLRRYPLGPDSRTPTSTTSTL